MCFHSGLLCLYLSPGFAFASGSCKVFCGGSLHIAWCKESLEEAEILLEIAEVASDLALTLPYDIL